MPQQTPWYYLQNTIKSTRNNPMTIWTEFDSTDALAMTLVCLNASFFSGDPKYLD